MKVVIEGSLFKRRLSGVGNYTKCLFEAVEKIDKSNTYNTVSLPRLKQTDPGAAKLTKTRGVVPIEIYTRLYGKRLAPPINLSMAQRANVFVFPNFVTYPLVGKAKSVVFIYDLAFLHHSEYVFPKTVKLLKQFVPVAVQRSNHIITISEHSKEEIVESYDVDPNKISIVYPAVDHAVFSPSAASFANPQEKYKTKKKYVLYSGNLEPRKNIVGIINAYAALPAELRKSYSLVLAGARGWLDEDIQKALDHHRSEDIIITGYVTEKDLAALYANAALFVYPSFYEGFGMPPLEAMACGCPVITAKNSSLPEVVGTAAIFTNTDSTAISASMKAVLTNPHLAHKLRAKGLLQAKKFQWAASAKKFISVLNNLNNL